MASSGYLYELSTRPNKKTFSYEITEEGVKNTNAYTALRQNVLIDIFKKKRDLNLDKLLNVLSELIAIYEEADRTVLSLHGNK